VSFDASARQRVVRAAGVVRRTGAWFLRELREILPPTNQQCAAVGLTMAAHWSGQSMAQSAAPLSDTELSKEPDNPVTRRIILPLRYEADFNDEPTKRRRTRSK
jgi:hypothetical protein